MPRAKSPEAYPEVMHQLRDVMWRTQETRLEFDLPKSKAWHVRQNFYAYIKAYKYEQERLIKAGDMEGAGHVHGTASMLMSWLCRVEDLDGQTTKAGGDPTQPCKLVFLNKAALPEFEDMMLKLQDYKAAAPPDPSVTPEFVRAIQAEAAKKQPGLATAKGATIVEQFRKMTHTEGFKLEDLPPVDEPPDPTDLSDLITPSNQAEPPTPEQYQQMMVGHLLPKDSEKKS